LGFTRVVYTDILPQGEPSSPHESWNEHFQSLTSEEVILQALIATGGKYAGLSDVAQFSRDRDGSYRVLLNDDCLFCYYFNMSDVEGLPADVLSDVRALYCHGYLPPSAVADKLPNVELVLATTNCTYLSDPSQDSVVDELRNRGVEVRMTDSLLWSFDGTQWLAENGGGFIRYIDPLVLSSDAPVESVFFDPTQGEGEGEADEQGEEE
jgi:hypothetical protein